MVNYHADVMISPNANRDFTPFAFISIRISRCMTQGSGVLSYEMIMNKRHVYV